MISKSKKTILLVEDMAIIAMAEANTLKKNGYNVIIAGNGNEAIRLASENSNLDLILMDIDLGKGMDGTEAAQIILESQDIPIVFLSNHTEKEIVDKTEKITSYGYVVKNCGETVLLASIKMAFKLFETHQQMLESEMKLIESDRKFHTLEKQIDDVIWTMDMNFRITYISPSVEKTHGYTVEEMMKLNLQDYLTEESSQKAINYLAEEISSYIQNGIERNIVTIELEQIKKDQTIFLTEIRARFLLDNKNNPIGIIGVTRDITHRLLAEKALRDSERTLNLALEGAQIGLWDQNFKTGIVYRSDHWATMLGYDPEEVKNNLDFWKSNIHPDDLEITLKEAKKHEQGLTEFYKVQHRLKCKNGKYKWILNWGKISERDEQGRPVRALGIHVDIDDNIKAEEALINSENKIRSIFKAAPVGIGVTSDRVLLEVNDTMCKMIGYSKDELIGKNALMLYPTTEEFELVGKEKYDQIKKFGTGTVETKWKCKDGKIIEVLLSSTPLNLVDISGGVTFTALDITERKESERMLKNSAMEKEALHRELLHRVKNSFNLIKSLVYLEREKLDNKEANKILENLEMRIGTLAHMYSLLNASGISQQIDLGEYLKQITNSLIESYLEDPAQIIIKSSFDKIVINPRAASSVGLIVNEILTNSLKYAFPDTKKGNIFVSLKKINEDAVIEITDDGVGVSDNFSFDDAKGMGLNLVNMLTQQLSGKATVEARNGTRFKIVFPLEQ